MFTKKAFELLMNFWCSLFISVIVSIMMSLIMTKSIPFPDILITIVIGLVVGDIVAIIIPANRWGDALAKKFKANVGTIKYLLISTIVSVICYGTILTFILTANSIGFPPFYFISVLKMMPLVLPIAYISALIATPIALKLTNFIIMKPKQENER
ncbi:MAG: DUF2798 domain-containing protein [Eubacteriaceae bacterium]